MMHTIGENCFLLPISQLLLVDLSLEVAVHALTLQCRGHCLDGIEGKGRTALLRLRL